MPATQTSVKTKLGENGLETDYRHESFDEFFLDIPNGARNLVLEKSEGLYVTTYTLGGGSSETSGSMGDPEEPEPEPGDPITTWTINGTVSQEPLATHPVFSATGEFPITDEEWDRFKKWERNPQDETLPPGWPNSEEDFASDGMIAFLAYYNKGKDSYLQGGITLRVQTENDEEPNCTNVGKIQAPEFKPFAPAGANWLLVGIDATKAFGGKWKVTREYRMSGPGGWDAALYG